MRQSPIHNRLESRGAVWHAVNETLFPVRLSDDSADQANAAALGICDVSGLHKFGLKGRDAERQLSSEGFSIPAAVYDSTSLEDGGLIIRIGKNEFFLEDGSRNRTVAAFRERFEPAEGDVFQVEHQEATFVLTGTRLGNVLAQTCGIDFREAAPLRFVFTRIAGVSCGMLPNITAKLPTCRLWVDPGYALYLWDTLVEIIGSLDGDIVGAGCIYPEWLE